MYKIENGDCVDGLKKLESDSVHMSLFSPPFAELYTYSDDARDMGNCKDYHEFFDHFDFLVSELARVIMPGRICAVHCQDVRLLKSKHGNIGLLDFSGMLISAFLKHGFIYASRVTIWKNPVTQMQRTKSLTLLHKQIKKDSSMSAMGFPDYMLIFRNAGENPEPIVNQDTDPNKENYLPVSLWQRYASPVWMDINQTKTLQYRMARDEKDEKHICPLQLETIERCIHLWSNEGDTILSPFAGIGSEGSEAIRLNRNFIGYELKKSYYDTMQKHLEYAEYEVETPKLF